MKREDYLRHADECVALAQRATDPEARAQFLKMAESWRELAEKENLKED